MKSLWPAAALALIIHGLLFSIKADWTASEPAASPEPKSLSLTMCYRTPPKPAAYPVVSIPLEIPFRPEEKKRQPVKPQKPVPTPARKVLIKSKSALAKTPTLQPQDEPAPEDATDTFRNQPPWAARDNNFVGESNPVLWARPPENNPSGSQDILEKNESPGLDKPQSIVSPRAYEDNPLPEYPRLAKRRGYEGVVTLEVLISQEGRVLEVRLLKSSGYSMLDEEARRAVKTYRFHPGRKDGEKVEMRGTIPIRFKLK